MTKIRANAADFGQADRAQARRNKITLTAWTGLLARLVTIGVSLIMVPLAVHYLGKEQYGVWVAVSSVIAMLGFMDGGAGNAVINMISHAGGADKRLLGTITSTALISLTVLAVLGGLLFLVVHAFVPWELLLGTPESLSTMELNKVVLVVGIFFFISMPVTLVGKIQRGMQEGNLDNFWVGVGSLLSLLFVYMAIQLDSGIVGFVTASLMGAMLAYLISNTHYFFFLRKELRPHLAQYNPQTAKHLFGVGGLFFILQITSTIQGQADNVIIANMLGAESVSNYAVCMRLFLSFSVFFSLALAPLWPAYREAIAANDFLWVKKTYFRTIKWSIFLGTPLALALVWFGEEIVHTWTRGSITPSQPLLVGCGLWMVAMFIGNSMASLLNAMQLIRIQIIIAVIAGLTNIILTVWWIRLVGIEGAVYANVVSFFLCAIVPYSIILPKALNRMGWAHEQ